MSDTVSEKNSDAEISREEIVKKFDLPERKTKIDTILKLHEEQQQQPVYCLCQSTDISKFMICCEKCDEWYHGDCIGLEERDAKLIKKWYCFECIEKHGLKVVYFPHDTKKASHSKKKEKKHKKRHNHPYRREELMCGRCSNCLQHKECGNKDYKRFCERHPKNDNCENSEPSTATSSKIDEHSRKFNKEKKQKEREERRRFAELGPVGCGGPGCNKMSRVNSKYCSDECGLAMAKARIMWILPSRVAQHQDYPCVANQLDMSKLEDIRCKKAAAYSALQELDVKEKILRDLIVRAKKVPIVDTEEEFDDDSKLYCVTCGFEIPSRSFVKHMESCFRKFESQTAVEGLTKLNSKCCQIFCDHHDKAKNTYCMRLRYVCPDHFKPKKVEANEVCGCPVIKTVSSSTFSEAKTFCQKAKKACDLHYNWEILALSDIDLERHREWNKICVLVGQESQIVKQMSNRLGALGLLLHSTEMNHLNTVGE